MSFGNYYGVLRCRAVLTNDKKGFDSRYIFFSVTRVMFNGIKNVSRAFHANKGPENVRRGY